MRSRSLLLFVLLACSPLVWSQGRLGAPTTSVTASFTLSVTGGGTGTVSSADGQIALCANGGGTCSGTYLIGSTVVLTPTASGGSLFAWSTGTDGASVCAGAGGCTFVITANATLVGIFSGSGAGAIQASPYFSIDLNSASQYPSGGSCSGTFQNCINQGQNRFWDTPNVTIPFLETCDNGTFICTSTHVVYTFNAANGFDTLLATMNNNSVHTAQMALGRMPVFASKQPRDGSCNYYSTFTPGGDTVRINSGIPTVTWTGGATPFSSAWVGSVMILPDTDFGGAATILSVDVGAQTLTIDRTFGGGLLSTTMYVNSSTLPQFQAGQCQPPSDLNSDGTGVNLYWRNSVAKVAAHANGKDGNAGYLTTHAHITEWETWNEPSVVKFWRGTPGELIRMQEDLYALVKGYSGFALTFTGVANTTGTYNIASNSLASNNNLKGAHYNIAGFASGANNLTNAVVTASTTTTITVCVLAAGPVCNAPVTSSVTAAGTGTYVNQFTGETDAQIQATVTSVSPVYPIDSTSQVVMPSYFGQGVGLTQLQQFLYCTSLPTNCGPAAVPAANWFGGHLTADAINFHGKEGGNFPTLAESVLDTWVSAITGILSTADLAKPFYNTEGGYAGGGWIAPYTDVDMQASYIGRMYAYTYFKGITNHVWYDWAPGSSGLGSSQANIAYTNIYNWMVGATSYTCSSASGVYTCTMNLPDGTAAQIMWDVNQSCSGGVCTTTNQTVPNPMLHYLLLTDSTQTPQSISSHLVPVGIKPVLVEAK